MKKYTDYSDKRAAVSVCLKLWMWLRDHPGKEKREWPFWDRHKMNPKSKLCRTRFFKEEPLFHCPCCEHVLRKLKNLGYAMRCCNPEETLKTSFSRGPVYQAIETEEANTWLNTCPLKGIWTKGCCHKTSPFRRWEKATIRLCALRSRKPHHFAAIRKAKIDCMKNAQIIVDECRRVLKELPRTGKNTWKSFTVESRPEEERSWPPRHLIP